MLTPSGYGLGPWAKPWVRRAAHFLQEATHTHPRLHAVWDRILALFSQTNSAQSDDEVTWPQFWLAVVDGTFGDAHECRRSAHTIDGAGLCSNQPWIHRARMGELCNASCAVTGGLLLSSSERRYAALRLVVRVTDVLSADHVKATLSPAVVRTLSQALSRKDDLLVKPAGKTVRGLRVNARVKARVEAKAHRLGVLRAAVPDDLVRV